MAEAQSTYTINLEDGTSGPADNAASALQDLRTQIDADTKSLAAMQKAMKNLQSGNVVNVKQFKELKEQINLKKQAVASNTSALLSLGGSLKSTSSSGKGMKSMLEQLKKQTQDVPGPLNNLVGGLESLKGLVSGGIIAAGILLIVTAMMAITAAAIAASAALLKYGISQANARRAELLRLEGLTKIRNWYGIAAGSATDLQNAIDNVSSKTAIGRDQVAKYAEQLYRAHLRGQNLEYALEGVAIKASTQGEEQAKMFASWAAGAALTGRSVKKLADDVKARLGGIAAKQMIDLDVQAQKMRENFDALFRGLKIEGLLSAISKITELFSQSTSTGRALKVLIETIFQPMIDAIEYLAPTIKRFFQGIVIGALLLVIAILKVRNWFKKTFGDSEMLRGFDATNFALNLGIATVSAFIGVLGVLALVAATVAAPFAIAATLIYGLVRAIKFLYKLWTETDWTGLGKSIIDGIVTGLKKGAKWVYDAIKSLGTTAWKTFKSTLGIASPSKVFTNLGVQIPRGIEVGVQSGKNKLNNNINNIVEIPTIDPISISDSNSQQSDSKSGKSSKNSQSVTFQFGDINVTGNNGKEQAENFKQQLEHMLEGIAIQLGAKIA